MKLNRREFLGTASIYAGGGRLGLRPRTATIQAAAMSSSLSKFTANSRFDSIPPKALEAAKTAITDCLGVAVAGSREESAQISGKLAREERAKEETSIYGQRFKS